MVKKIFVGTLAVSMICVLLFGIVFTGLMGDESGSTTAPIQIVATEKEAYGYQYIGTELGVPWDIVLLTDAIHAQREEKKLKEYNPLYTSLEFCELQEEKYVALFEEVEIKELVEPTEDTVKDATQNDDEISFELQKSTEESSETSQSIEFQIMSATEMPQNQTEVSEGTMESIDDDEAASEEISTEETSEVPETENEPEYIIRYEKRFVGWERDCIKTFSGKDEILRYIDSETDKLDYSDAADIIVKINEKAESKLIEEEEYYVATLTVNPDYEWVLQNRIGLSGREINNVLQLYDAGYFPTLYGYTCYVENIELPEITVGNVSRSQLAQVAVSIMGHPYIMGGKSSEQGAPKGPLDCSGYVDWVYVQCFGKTVSTGALPDEVAVSGTAQQWFACQEIKEKELKVGDLGFMKDPKSMWPGQVNHVGIYLGTYNNKKLWIHCGGSSYGTTEYPNGRVGISAASGYNEYNPVDGSTFSPAMKNCRFRYYRRPQFAFTDD